MVLCVGKNSHYTNVSSNIIIQIHVSSSPLLHKFVERKLFVFLKRKNGEDMSGDVMFKDNKTEM